MKFAFGLFTGLVIGVVLGFLICSAVIKVETEAKIAAVREEMDAACEEKTQDAINDQKQELEENYQLAKEQRERFWKDRNEIVREKSWLTGFESGQAESDRECSERVSKSEQRIKEEYMSLLRDVRSTYKDADIREKRSERLVGNTRGDPNIPDENDELIAFNMKGDALGISPEDTHQLVKNWFIGLGCFLLFFLIIRGFKKDFKL